MNPWSVPIVQWYCWGLMIFNYLPQHAFCKTQLMRASVFVTVCWQLVARAIQWQFRAMICYRRMRAFSNVNRVTKICHSVQWFTWSVPRFCCCVFAIKFRVFLPQTRLLIPPQQSGSVWMLSGSVWLLSGTVWLLSGTVWLLSCSVWLCLCWGGISSLVCGRKTRNLIAKTQQQKRGTLHVNHWTEWQIFVTRFTFWKRAHAPICNALHKNATRWRALPAVLNSTKTLACSQISWGNKTHAGVSN